MALPTPQPPGPYGLVQPTTSTPSTGVYLLRVNNLSDLANVATARKNLGLGSAATEDSSAFDSSGAAANALAQALAAIKSATSGGPTGPAGGDLSGSYPNPTLASIGSATGPIGDSTHVASVTIDAKGRVTGLSSIAIAAGGTVTSVATGTGLTGGPITTSGTIAANLASSSVFGVVKVDGTTITSSSGVISAVGAGSGTVTNVASGNGLTGGPITTSGTLSVQTTASVELVADVSGHLLGVKGVFNVQAFGATGNGTTDDTAKINSAIAALIAYASGNSCGCLYFPAGTYVITSAITAIVIPEKFSLTVKGDGMLSTFILQTSSGYNGLSFSLTPDNVGGSYFARSSVEISDLGFSTNTTAASAVYVTYGTNTLANGGPCGLVFKNINIQSANLDTTNTYGWTNGIYLVNVWKIFIRGVNGTGGQTSGAAVPSTGTTPTNVTAPSVISTTQGSTTPGFGGLIVIYGGNNMVISDIYAAFWQFGVYLGLFPDGVTGQQGVLMTNVNLVAIFHGLHQVEGAGSGPIIASNWQIDQGNPPNNGLQNVGLYLGGSNSGGTSNHTFSNIWMTQAGTGICVLVNDTGVGIFTGLFIFAAGSGGAVLLTGSSSKNIFNGCSFGGNPIAVSSGCSDNQANNTGGSITTGWTGVGTGNTILTTLY